MLTIALASLFLAACTGAKTGVLPDGALTTNQRPAISIKANAPFALVDAGRVWASPKTDMLPGSTNASFDYAVYAEPASSPASAFAYAAILKLTDNENWEFMPQSNNLPGVFGGRKGEAGMRSGYSYTLHVPASDDWASELLAANGVAVPQAWIGKRWLFSLDTDVRALAEYREPWPAGLAMPEGADVVLLDEGQAAFLRDFERRAVAVFSFTPAPGDFKSAAPRVSAWNKAPVLPNIEKLMGDIIHKDNGNTVYND